MDEHRDIYTKPSAKPEESGPALPAPEPSPAELRAMTRRRTAYSIALMVLILGAAAVYFFEDQDREEVEELEAIDVEAGRTRRPAPLASIPPALPDEIATSLDKPLSPQAPPDMPPQRLAEIMARLRESASLMRDREWDAAESRIREALAIWPDMNLALRMLGALYIQRGQFDQAVIVLERAMRADPLNMDAFVNLAIANMQLGRLERAEDLMLTAVQIRPDIVYTHINLGLLYILWGRYDQAAEHLQIAVDRVPDNHSARNNLGVALIRLGRHGEAREHFQHLINRRPDRPEAYFNAAITYVLDRNYEAAFSMLRRGVARCSPVEARRNLMDSDFDTIRELPEFRALWSDLSDPRRFAQQQSF